MYKLIEQLRRNPMAIFVSVFAAFGGLLYGYDTGTISGIIDMNYFLQTFGHRQLDGTYQLTSRDKSLIVSILSAGTFFGALLGYPAGDFLGRRWGLIVACLIFSIGVSFQVVATAIPLFAVGRVVAGLGVGLISCIVPIYQSECAPKWIRGTLVSAYQWLITIGFLLAAIANNETKDIHSHACYRIPIGIQLILAAILAIGMFFLPESPRYLVLKGDFGRAHQAQAKLNWSAAVDENLDTDIDEIIANMELTSKYDSSTYADCFKMGPQKNLFRTLVGIFLQAWQQLTGINFIMYYGTSFFHSSGIQQPFFVTIVINLINVCMTIPGMLLMDKIGRRKILIIGAAGMLVCQYIIAISSIIVDQSNAVFQKTLVAFVCIFIAFFASTWGPAAWVVTGELYPLAIRAKCMSLSTASNWLCNFALGYVTPYMVDADKGNMGSKVFFLWGSMCIGCLLFAKFCIWETKGLSLEQIDDLVCNSSPVSSDKANDVLKASEINHERAHAVKYQ
ncbi:unnamed protein product [Rotaria sp. Silwood1]|nr:unnamed protein product [Rotaria sp. Silwood1]CAF1441685.1 unnamed protein product [Rotaria sp. Silwood1]CAF1464006.1 unnamed protein product [Rotaria sp. Silwood1]CAF3635262.1 unnamed protein product [Rotaria sp. Silwood1]CAF4887379.1 unnamed protein product [Rotaria sp. Silwood1]